MCRLEQISYEMGKRFGTTFSLYDCLQGSALGVLCIAEERHQVLNLMVEAVSFIRNTAGVVPPRGDGQDRINEDESFSFIDILLRIKNIQKIYEKRMKAYTIKDKEKTSFINELLIN
jgi:hypothetical protein